MTQSQTRSSDELDIHLSDLGNARRLVKRYGTQLQFCPEYGKWMWWDGKRWVVDSTGVVMRGAKETVGSMLDEAKHLEGEEKKKLLDWHLHSESQPSLRRMLELATTEPGIPVTTDKLDRNPWLLNTPNGTVDLLVGETGEHLPSDLITKIAGAPFHEDATCPRWMEFLDQVFAGNQEVIRFVQKAVGYSLTGETTEQVFFILLGSGDNGKSTFLEVVRHVLGDYAMSTDFSTFTAKHCDRTRNDIARLTGARMVTASEGEHGARLAESLIKQLTGGETIAVRFLWREFFEYKPRFKIWIASNHKPQVFGSEHAIWRRIRLIPFTVRIRTENRDKNLVSKLCCESPGILRWAIDGCSAWRTEGLEPPVDVIAAVAEYRAEMDVLGKFLDQCCVVSENATVNATALYNSYKTWCKDTGERIENRTSFGLMLKERGFAKEK